MYMETGQYREGVQGPVRGFPVPGKTRCERETRGVREWFMGLYHNDIPEGQTRGLRVVLDQVHIHRLSRKGLVSCHTERGGLLLQ